jgi:hypothetical protein
MNTRNKNKYIPQIKITSAVAQHIKDEPTHVIQFHSSTIIKPERRYFHRKYKERLYIKKPPVQPHVARADLVNLTQPQPLQLFFQPTDFCTF